VKDDVPGDTATLFRHISNAVFTAVVLTRALNPILGFASSQTV